MKIRSDGFALVTMSVLLLGACASAAPGPSPSVSPGGSVEPSPAPSETADFPSGFYLRAWYSQALPPDATFSWGPLLTIVDGTQLDGNVAVPAIYPGPLMIVPTARWISDTGTGAIIDEAGRLGVLGEQTDFTGGQAMPGQRLGQIEIVVDGVRRTLTGDPDLSVTCDGATCTAEPGSPEAFAAFWQQLSTLQAWLEGELGAIVQYEPQRVALLLTTPSPAEPGLSPAPVAWPFGTPLAEAGVPYPTGAGERCVTLEGDALAAMMPVLRGGNQLTVLVDETGDARSAVVRVLMPGEDSPCDA